MPLVGQTDYSALMSPVLAFEPKSPPWTTQSVKAPDTTGFNSAIDTIALYILALNAMAYMCHIVILQTSSTRPNHSS